MTSKEFEKIISTYKSEVKASRVERPLTQAEINRITENIDNIPDEYKNAFEMAKNGNFGKFEKLPHLLRNYLGAIELKKFRDKFGPEPSIEDAEVSKYLENNAMNAALRAGISAEKNADATKEYARALDSHMNKILMQMTMMPPGEPANEARNMAKQLVIAKTMLLMQIGKYDLLSKNGLSRELDVPVYETLVHGNRANFILPGGKDSNLVIDAFMGQNNGADAGIEKRTAATHSASLRKLDQNGVIASETKESKTFSPFKVFSNQYGMNIAVGGLGSKGPDGKAILGNGEAGHIYMRAESGDAKHCGSLLIGIEGSAPGASNYLGNSHGIRAKSAKQSAFLADKSIAGKKIGGRQIDLSGVSATELSGLLNEFSQKYASLQGQANTAEGREKLSKVNDMLMGKHMDAKALAELFGTLEMAGEKLPKVISKARMGYFAGVNAKNMTDEEFKQKIRSSFSQEQACSLAKARFKYAGDDLELAVGAIKELMFTHETRTLGWKILHPIRNSREKKTISSLMKRLETKKGFTPSEIASAINYYDNTFALDFGKELSYDRDAIQFSLDNAHTFKPSENKLFSVLTKAYNSIVKKIGEDVIAEAETATMKAELEEFVAEDTYREQIMISEADESNNVLEQSAEIIPEQPVVENQKDL